MWRSTRGPLARWWSSSLVVIAGCVLAIVPGSGGIIAASSVTSTVTDWEDRIPGVWLATVEGQPGEEMWTFNGRTMIANRQYWPRGFGVTNPLDNGVAAPLQISKSWSVDGDTLTVTSAFRESVYENLRVDNTRCFSADLDGSRVQFCRLRI